jgi:integrase
VTGAHRGRREFPPGVRRHGAGLEASVKVRGERSYQSFPLNTPIREITTWQEDERATLRLLTTDRPRAGTLAGDAPKYLKLPSVQHLVDVAQRVQHITEWVAVLGSKRRRSRGWPEAIETQRDRWLTDPREVHEDGSVKIGPYAAASVNKRLRALSNLWTKLDGRRAYNPVLEVDECEEPDPTPRGLPYDVIEAILAAIPETAIGVKKDGTRTIGKNIPRPSQTKARLRVIAYTGIPHSTLKRLTPASVTLFPLDGDGQETGGTVLLPPRRKGKKRRRAQDKPLPELLPLIPPAAAAFRAFDQLGCWTVPGTKGFSNSSMWKTFQRACTVLGIEGVRPYDLRHSLGSAIYAETKDLRVTGVLLGHRSDRTSKRYTLAAVPAHVAEAMVKVAARLRPHALPPDPATRRSDNP